VPKEKKVVELDWPEGIFKKRLPAWWERRMAISDRKRIERTKTEGRKRRRGEKEGRTYRILVKQNITRGGEKKGKRTRRAERPGE